MSESSRSWGFIKGVWDSLELRQVTFLERSETGAMVTWQCSNKKHFSSVGKLSTGAGCPERSMKKPWTIWPFWLSLLWAETSWGPFQPVSFYDTKNLDFWLRRLQGNNENMNVYETVVKLVFLLIFLPWYL